MKVHGNLRNSKSSSGSKMYRVMRKGVCEAKKFEGGSHQGMKMIGQMHQRNCESIECFTNAVIYLEYIKESFPETHTILPETHIILLKTHKGLA